MWSLLVSTVVVALAEMGDKIQLLSFVLAAKLKRKGAIVIGILVATLANHFLAGYVGVFLTAVIAFFLVEMGDKTQLATIATIHDTMWGRKSYFSTYA